MKRTPLKRGKALERKAPMKRGKRLAPKKSRRLAKPLHSDPALPAVDEGHLDRVRALGCVVCFNLGRGWVPACAHHLRTGYGEGQKAPDHEAIPLCAWHHQNGPIGEGFHNGTRTWQRRFGTELELLAQTNEQLQEKGPH